MQIVWSINDLLNFCVCKITTVKSALWKSMYELEYSICIVYEEPPPPRPINQSLKSRFHPLSCVPPCWRIASHLSCMLQPSGTFETLRTMAGRMLAHLVCQVLLTNQSLLHVFTKSHPPSPCLHAADKAKSVPFPKSLLGNQSLVSSDDIIWTQRIENRTLLPLFLCRSCCHRLD
jgi:hypothetical protein